MEALQAISKFFSGPSGSALTKIAEIGATGAGLFGNLSAERQRSQELDYLKKQQNALGDPRKIAADVAGATQPLNRALVQSIENQVSGTLAEQGLSQAPGIQATAVAQALAPFEQQNQQTALQIVMKRLGLPIEYGQTLLAGNPGQTNLAPLLALLQKGGGFPSASQPPASFSAPTADWTASFPGITPATPPDTSGWQLPDWLTSTPETAPSFGG